MRDLAAPSRPALHALAALLLTSTLLACGGGSGSGDDDGGGGGGSSLNGDLAGTMYFDASSQYVAFDVKTGISTKIYGTAGDGTTPSANASEFVNIQNTPDPKTAYNTEDVVFFNRDGTVTKRLTWDDSLTSGTGRPNLLTGIPKLAPNGAMFAEGYGNGEATFVADRNGSISKTFNGVGSYAWMPDNRLALIKDEALYITDSSLSVGAAPVKTFAGGQPSNLAVSPDGTRIALKLYDGSGSSVSDYHIWVINSDGSGAHQISNSALGESSPGWSPDSSKVALIKGISSEATCPELWVVPADASMATLQSDSPAPAQAIRQVDGGTTRPSTCIFDPPVWLD